MVWRQKDKRLITLFPSQSNSLNNKHTNIANIPARLTPQQYKHASMRSYHPSQTHSLQYKHTSIATSPSRPNAWMGLQHTILATFPARLTHLPPDSLQLGQVQATLRSLLPSWPSGSSSSTSRTWRWDRSLVFSVESVPSCQSSESGSSFIWMSGLGGKDRSRHQYSNGYDNNMGNSTQNSCWEK